jgi:hypothetical protein
MAAIGFGFSPSDIALAISIISKVVLALKSNEPLEELIETISFLERLCLVLSDLQELNKTSSRSQLLNNAIATSSGTLERPLRAFLDELQQNTGYLPAFGNDVTLKQRLKSQESESCNGLFFSRRRPML